MRPTVYHRPPVLTVTGCYLATSFMANIGTTTVTGAGNILETIGVSVGSGGEGLTLTGLGMEGYSDDPEILLPTMWL